jgi:hypothetical protein
VKKSEIEIGATYMAKVSGKLTTVRIVSESQHGGWNAINTATKHAVRIRGAARLRRKVEQDRLATIRSLRQGGATFEEARAQIDREELALRDAAQDLRAQES